MSSGFVSRGQTSLLTRLLLIIISGTTWGTQQGHGFPLERFSSLSVGFYYLGCPWVGCLRHVHMRRDVATLCAVAAGPAHGAWEVPTRLGEDLAREASEDSHSTGTPKRNTFQPPAYHKLSSPQSATLQRPRTPLGESFAVTSLLLVSKYRFRYGVWKPRPPR